MTEKRYFLHKHFGRDVIHDTICHNWLKGEELEEDMNVQYTKYSALKKENEQLKKEKESWKSNACNQSSFNSILLNELSIAQKQGYEVSNPFKKFIREKE